MLLFPEVVCREIDTLLQVVQTIAGEGFIRTYQHLCRVGTLFAP